VGSVERCAYQIGVVIVERKRQLWHLPCSISVPDSLFPESIHVFFGLLLGQAPSTSYSKREMCMVMGKTRIPWDSHGNGNTICHGVGSGWGWH